MEFYKLHLTFPMKLIKVLPENILRLQKVTKLIQAIKQLLQVVLLLTYIFLELFLTKTHL